MPRAGAYWPAIMLMTRIAAVINVAIGAMGMTWFADFYFDAGNRFHFVVAVGPIVGFIVLGKVMSGLVSRFSASSRRIGRSLIVIVSATAIASCGDMQKGAVPKLDHAADVVPFPAPAVAAQLSLSGVPALPPDAQETLELRRAFFAGDFARVESAMNDAHEKTLGGQSEVPAATLVDALSDTQLAGIDSCARWLEAMPKSYAAHWLCAAIWRSGAWAARTHEFANKVSPARFALMRERLDRSNELLKTAVALTPKPLEALAMLGDNHLLGGNRTEGEAYLVQAEQILPSHASIHYSRIVFAMPEWGGSREQVRALLDRARQAGVDEKHLLDMEDEYVVRPWHMSAPGAGRAYWEQAIAKRALRSRLLDLTKHLVHLENWQDALPVASRLTAEHPGLAEGHYLRARINEGLGRNADAWGDYRKAAALGHDFALQTLIQTHIRGGLGMPGKAFAALDEVCRYGATLGSSVAANCLGGLFFEGKRGGGPYDADTAQAFAWHQFAARGGHYNSQHDLGWLLYTGRGPAVDPQLAKTLGVFWLRRAAEQDHEFAKRKLAEGGIGATEALEAAAPGDTSISRLLATVHAIFKDRF